MSRGRGDAARSARRRVPFSRFRKRQAPAQSGTREVPVAGRDGGFFDVEDEGVLIEGTTGTGIRQRADGLYAITYRGELYGYWTKRRWARGSLRAAKRSGGLNS